MIQNFIFENKYYAGKRDDTDISVDTILYYHQISTKESVILCSQVIIYSLQIKYTCFCLFSSICNRIVGSSTNVFRSQIIVIYRILYINL